jgi:2-C-methyl-D-erythritol 2,4-cyclodiphosphate synthase
VRVGTGFDAHAFGPGDSVMLGGVRIAHTRGVTAHSDGDVILHALCDALLGAAGLGDIGEHFPDSDAQWQGADSTRFVATVMEMLKRRGFTVANADVTLLAQAPRIAQHRREIRHCIATTLGILEERINIKATTTEHMGFIGRSEGLAAIVTVLLDESARG